jgi:hypothetical protein
MPSRPLSLESTCERLANSVECQLASIVTQLITESQTGRALNILGSGDDLIRQLRKASGDAEQGGDV